MYLLALFFSFVSLSAAAASPFYYPGRTEVFTTTDQTVVHELVRGYKEWHQNIDIQVYEMNSIQLVEVELSRDLTANPDQSKRFALQRIQALDDQARARMQRSAVGLVRAIQYGIDRYPAIVFDGQAVVYGVTDLNAALAYYQMWRTEVKR